MPDRVDDPTINDEDMLWRRIVNDPTRVTYSDDGWRVSSVAFIDRYTGRVSVHLAKLTSQQAALNDRPNEGLVEIAAGLPRRLGLIVDYDPTDEDESHCVIHPPGGGAISKSKARTLAQAAQWLVKPLRIR
jgi:hypothetical protein